MSNPKISIEAAQQAIDAVNAHGSQQAAARAMGLSRTTLQGRIEAAHRYKLTPQTQRLISAESAAAPEGYRLKGTSTLYGEDGAAKLQWVKTTQDQAAFEAMQKAAWESLAATLKPIPRIAAPRPRSVDLLNLVTITDAHVGALAWDK